jgi:hypothetical protein
MANFPLYTSLFKEFENTKEQLNNTDKEHIVNTIKKLDTNGHELIYALIKTYQIKHGDTFNVPYGMKEQKLGYKFDLDNIPTILQHMLRKFVDLHYSKMCEDKTRKL